MYNFVFIFFIAFCVTNTRSLYSDGDNRILNGAPANTDQFPYMVSLQQLSEIHNATRGHRCGGVLVTLQHALTAAYCTVDFDNEKMITINRNEYRVFGGGAADLTNDTSPDRVRRIANIVVHPEYNPTHDQFLNNIAVIILGTPFLSTTVTRLSIKDIGNANRKLCLIAGWDRRGGTLLTFQSMMAYNDTMCQIYMGSPLTPNLICGWYPGFASFPGHAGCPGDEGGPLVCFDYLVGLIIDTRGCETIPPRPHFYLRVSYYTAWIDSVVALPIPPLGPEPPTVPPPTTQTTPAPGAASSCLPGMTLLALIAIAQIITN